MSGLVLLNLINELGKAIKFEACRGKVKFHVDHFLEKYDPIESRSQDQIGFSAL